MPRTVLGTAFLLAASLLAQESLTTVRSQCALFTPVLAVIAGKGVIGVNRAAWIDGAEFGMGVSDAIAGWLTQAIKGKFPIAGFVRKCSSNQTLAGSYSECGRIRATSNKNIEGPGSTKLIRILNRPVVLTLRVNLIHRGELRVSSVHRPCHVIAIYTGMVARKESRIIWRGRTILDIAGEAKIRLSVKDRNSFLLATPLAFEVETPQRTCSANRLFHEATWELARN